MVQSLEQYVAQATQAYQPTQTAIQNQINALSGQLESTNEQINRNYAQQQAGLNRQRNIAAETASMQAAGSGGSFGGAANIANRKYYDQSFVPAVTQLRANQTNELERARQDNENQRLNYESQLANVQTQGQQQALNQYYADRQLEQQLAAQRAATAAQNSYNQYLLEAMKQAQKQASPYSLESNGYWVNNNTGSAVRVGTVAYENAKNSGQNFNAALRNLLNAAVANNNDDYSARVINELNNGARFTRNSGANYAPTGNAVYDTLGIRRIN